MPEMREIRWKKDGDFVAITAAVVTAGDDGNAWYVEKSENLKWEELPMQFRALVREADVAGYEGLKAAVAGWADRHGFEVIEG